MLQRRNLFLERKLQRQAKELTELRKFKRQATSAAFKKEVLRETLQKSFSRSQARILVNNTNRAKKWSEEDIVNGLILRSFSRRTYQHLRQKKLLPLPGLSTLRRWVKNFQCQPGLLTDVLKILKKYIESENNPLAKLGVINFDEMEVYFCYDYDQESDKVFGPHKKLQMVMLRGLCHSWKQPIFYNFDSQMKPDLLNYLVRKSEEAGVQVWAVVFDLGNVGILNKLGISPEKPYFANPVDPSRNIFVIPDVPHMLKLCRNHLLDEGFWIDEKTLFRKRDLESILALDKSEFKICPKLQQATHLDIKNSARQKVRPAAQVLSHSTATALKTLFPGKQKQADWVDTVNNWFDCMNSRTKLDTKKLSCGFGVHYDEQRAALEKMSEATQKLRSCKHLKSLLPFQKGILIGIQSVIQLFEKLKVNLDVKFILTTHLNQDIGENVFSRLRSLVPGYDHPRPVSCKNRYRLFIHTIFLILLLEVIH